MSSSQHDRDKLVRTCSREVRALHRLFVSWFQGMEQKETLQAELLGRLRDDFSHVAPNGQFLSGRDILIHHLDDKYGCYQNRTFQIDIYNVQLLWTDGTQFLCTYEEWQSWQQLDGDTEESSDEDNTQSDHRQTVEGGADVSSSSNQQQGDGVVVMNQFGRLSTCLLEKRPPDDGSSRHPFQWIHVHETWLESEAPDISEDAQNAPYDDEEQEEETEQGEQQQQHLSYGGIATAMGHNRASVVSAGSDDQHDAMSMSSAMTGPVEIQQYPPGATVGGSGTGGSLLERTLASQRSRAAAPLPVTADDEDETEEEQLLPPSPSLSQQQQQKPPPPTIEEDNSAPAAAPGSLNDRAVVQPDNGSTPDTTLLTISKSTSSVGKQKRRRHVVALISSSNKKQPLLMTWQQNAFAVLKQNHVPFHVVDAADPGQAARSKALVALTTGKLPAKSTPASHNGSSVAAMIPPSSYPLFFLEVEQSPNDEAEGNAGSGTSSTLHAGGSTDDDDAQENAAAHEEEEENINYDYPLPMKTFYWGDHQTLAESNDRDTVRQDLGFDGAVGLNASRDESPSASSSSSSSSSSSVSSAGMVATMNNEQSEPDDNGTADMGVQQQESILPSSDASSPPNQEQPQKLSGAAAILAAAGLPVDHPDPTETSTDHKDGELSSRQPPPESSMQDRRLRAAALMGGLAQANDAKTRPTVSSYLAPDDDKQYYADDDTSAVTSIVTASVAQTTASSAPISPQSITTSASQSSSVAASRASKSTKSTSASDVLAATAVGAAVASAVAAPPVTEDSSDGSERGEGDNKSGVNLENESEENGGEIEEKAEEAPQTTPSRSNPPAEETGVSSPIPQDVSKKRHVSSQLERYAKPLMWENALVGISIAGFDIGTSQGPIADEVWHEDVGKLLQECAQYSGKEGSPSRCPTRKLCLPEMVFPTAHVVLEGHGFWLSWDVLDSLEAWATCHQMIPIDSDDAYDGVSVLKSQDAVLWANKKKSQHLEQAVKSASDAAFHYDWTYGTPFCGKAEGGKWVELDESGMRKELLLDQTVPIIFFDDIVMYEDDMHDNGEVQFSVKVRVMPTCAYVLARYWLRVDRVVVRLRETRLLVDFFGTKPRIFRDVTWRECYWDALASHGLPTDVRSWHFEGRETPQFHALLQKLPVIDLPSGIFEHSVLKPFPAADTGPATGKKLDEV